MPFYRKTLSKLLPHGHNFMSTLNYFKILNYKTESYSFLGFFELFSEVTPIFRFLVVPKFLNVYENDI